MKGLLFLLLASCNRDYNLVGREAELEVKPDHLDFGEVPVGDVSVLPVTLTNKGEGRLEVSDVVVDGAAAFTLLEDPGDLELQPGEKRTINVVYTAASDADAGRLRIAARNQAVATVPLTGAVAPLTADPGGKSEIPLELGVDETMEVPLTFVVHGSVDVAFLLDTTSSMNALADAVAGEFENIARDLSDYFDDASFGLATYEDYGVYPFGAPGVDRPFHLRAEQTTDRVEMERALADVVINEGQDAPEATMEALRQAVTGVGYDLNCNGRFDEASDVLPYRESPTDPFGGTAGSAGTSGRGGFGFREGRIPIVVYATNYELRDADNPRYRTPTGCPAAAGMSDVVDGLAAIGGHVVAVAVNLNPSGYAVGQMQQLAEESGSLADLDGDGRDEPAVVVWSGTSGEFHERVVNAIRQLSASMHWNRAQVTMDDPSGLVVDVEPLEFMNVQGGDRLHATATIHGVPAGQTGKIAFQLIGDGGVILATTSIVVTNPG